MSWFGFDPDFDDFFGEPRKYATEVPPNFNPRKIAQGDNGKDNRSLVMVLVLDTSQSIGKKR